MAYSSCLIEKGHEDDSFIVSSTGTIHFQYLQFQLVLSYYRIKFSCYWLNDLVILLHSLYPYFTFMKNKIQLLLIFHMSMFVFEDANHPSYIRIRIHFQVHTRTCSVICWCVGINVCVSEAVRACERLEPQYLSSMVSIRMQHSEHIYRISIYYRIISYSTFGGLPNHKTNNR